MVTIDTIVMHEREVSTWKELTFLYKRGIF